MSNSFWDDVHLFILQNVSHIHFDYMNNTPLIFAIGFFLGLWILKLLFKRKK